MNVPFPAPTTIRVRGDACQEGNCIPEASTTIPMPAPTMRATLRTGPQPREQHQLPEEETARKTIFAGGFLRGCGRQLCGWESLHQRELR